MDFFPEYCKICSLKRDKSGCRRVTKFDLEEKKKIDDQRNKYNNSEKIVNKIFCLVIKYFFMI